MKTIYVDNDFKCHIIENSSNRLLAVITNKFEDKCVLLTDLSLYIAGRLITQEEADMITQEQHTLQ